MPVTWTVTLGQQCLGEFLGTMVTIFLGESIIANELLPGTKGHEMGWGWVAFAFGVAFFIGIQCFNFLSAHLNPAMLMALWCRGLIDTKQFFALSCCEVAGAFTGAVLVWLHFLPHFKTVPQPPPPDLEQAALQNRDYLGSTALHIASYQCHPHKEVKLQNLRTFRKNVLSDLRYYTRDHDKVVEHTPAEVLHDYYSKQSETNLVRKSVQVADLQRQMRKQHVEKVVRMRSCVGCAPEPEELFLKYDDSMEVEVPPRAHSTGSAVDHLDPDLAKYHVGDADTDAVRDKDVHKGMAPVASHPAMSSPFSSGAGDTPGGAEAAMEAEKADLRQAQQHFADTIENAIALSDNTGSALAPVPEAVEGKGANGKSDQPGFTKHKHRVTMSAVQYEEAQVAELYRRAIVADQNAKLSIFATRPAIYSPIFNCLTEFMGTVALILVAQLLDARSEYYESELVQATFEALIPFFEAFMIFLMIVGLGGPTGYAVNPARDMGPRLAHFFLPIPNKGPSEFLSYSWVPFFAPLAGGAAAAGLFLAITAGYPEAVPIIAS